MEPPSPTTPALSFDTEALGQRQAWTVHHRGLEYSGEVIIAEAVDPSWGQPLEDGLAFRLVFFTVPRRVPYGHIQDPRTAMSVPRRSPEQVRYLGSELRAIREARERYITSREPDALALRRSMEERATSLRGEMARRYAMSYSLGRIYTHPSITVRAREIFTEQTPESWARHLASAVLLQAFPALPFDHSDFPDTLDPDRVAALYRGLFQGDRDSGGVVQAFGPGLGLTQREAPSLFDAGECRAVTIIQQELESRGGEMPGREVLRALAESHGLTRTLALLFLMAFVRQAHAEIEFRVGHKVESRGGSPFPGDHITWDLVPEVSFTDSLAEDVQMLRVQPSVTWDTVLPYATLLVEGLAPTQDGASLADQERQLLVALVGMAEGMADARRALDALEERLGPVPPDALEHLQGLESLCAVSSYREFYTVAQERFQGPSGLGDSLDLYGRLGRLATEAHAVAETKSYLDRMTFGREHEGLMVELESLLANPSLWGTIEASFQRLRTRHANAYVKHHAGYRQEALELSRRLDELGPQVGALARFNDMPELGEPVGTEVSQLFTAVTASFRTCPAGDGELSLEDVPCCRHCQLPLDEDVPREEAERLFGATQRAMREYNRRLSSRSIRRILAHPTREQLDKFINLLQVADPSALANALDDEVVEFLRQFMGDG